MQSRSLVYRFQFADDTDMEEVEKTLFLSILAVGFLHGEAAVRLDAGYAVDAEKRVVAVDAATETGRAVTRVFTGFCILEYGDENFSIVRGGDPLPQSPAAAEPAGAAA